MMSSPSPTGKIYSRCCWSRFAFGNGGQPCARAGTSKSNSDPEYLRHRTTATLGNETLSLEILDAFCFPACAGRQLRYKRLSSTTSPNSPRSTAGRRAATATTTACRLTPAARDVGWPAVRLQLHLFQVNRRWLQRRARERFRVRRPRLQQPGDQCLLAESLARGLGLRHHASVQRQLGLGCTIWATDAIGAGDQTASSTLFGGWGLNGSVALDQRISILRCLAGAGWATDFELEGTSFVQRTETQDRRLP